MAAETSAQDSGAQKNEPTTPGTAQTGQEAVSLEAIKNMIEESNRPLHAEIRRLREAAKPKPQQTEAEATLSQRLKALEEREAKAADKDKVNSIRAAAIKQGVPEDRVDVFVDHVLAQRGSQIIGSADGAVWDQYGDVETRQPITALISEVLKTRGDVFKPAAALPKARGMQANGRAAPKGGYLETPAGERLKMSAEARLQLVKDSVGV